MKNSKSRNTRGAEELNATYSIKKSENKKSLSSFSGKGAKNENSMMNCKKRAKNLETYANLLQKKIEKLERELEHEKQCTNIIKYRGNTK